MIRGLLNYGNILYSYKSATYCSATPVALRHYIYNYAVHEAIWWSVIPCV